MKASRLFLALFVVATLALAGCAQGESDVETYTFIPLESDPVEVPAEDIDFEGPNGCVMYQDVCYIQSEDPEDNGAYRPEGTGI